MVSQNKMRSQKSKAIMVYTYLISAVITIALCTYLTYVYLRFSNPQNAVMDNLIITFNAAFSEKALELTFEMQTLLAALKMQITSLWWVYGALALAVFLMKTSRTKDDFHGMEHGSARWADKYDMRDFADKTGIPVGKDFFVTVENAKGKSYAPHNLNEIIIGGPGAGKTFRKIKPDIMQMFGSYVVTDPKGELYRDTAKLLKKAGYKIRVLNLIDISNSNTYNPFAYMKSEQDVLNIADLFMKNSAGDGEREDFWVGAAQDLLVCCMIYLFKSESEIKSFGRVLRLINSITFDPRTGQLDPLCEFYRCLTKHAHEHPNDAAAVNFKGMHSTPLETMGSIIKTLSTRLRLYAVTDVDELTTADEMDFDSVGVEKTAIFLIIPAARQTYKAIANIFYSQLFERLMYVANFKYNGRLPLLVSCELDEFANIGKIPAFNETLSVVRSCNIRICIVLQGISQLKALYEKTWESIIGNCSLFTYLGTNDLDTKKYVVERLGEVTVRTDTKSHNRGNQGGGADNESYSGRKLLTVDELAIAMKPKGESKKYGGNMIEFIDEYRPFWLYKFDTVHHPHIGCVGSSRKADWHNNTDIEQAFSGTRQQRREEYEKRLQAWKEQNEIDLKSAGKSADKLKAEKKEKDKQEQIRLKAEFEKYFGKKDEPEKIQIEAPVDAFI